MKLLLATQDFPPVEGGMARYYASLAAGFSGGQIVVSTTEAVGIGGAAPDGFAVYRETFGLRKAHRPLNSLLWSAHLEKLVKRERPDVLLCGNIRPLGPICWQIHRRLRVPYVLILHGNDVLAARRRWAGWRRPLWNAVTGDALLWVTNSRAVAALAADACGLDASRNAVLYPEVDTTRFQPPTPEEKRTLRRSLGLQEDVPVILFVGRLVARKGLDRLIEAAARLPRERPWCLAVAGYGDAEPYRANAERHGIADRLRFLGAVPEADLPGVYGAADLLAMPSRTIAERGDVEGFGIVYLEAAAAGLPSIAGLSGGAPEAVLTGSTGLVVDGEATASIAAALNRLIENEPLRRAMGIAGRRRAADSFGTGSMARRCIEILNGRIGIGPAS